MNVFNSCRILSCFFKNNGLYFVTKFFYSIMLFYILFWMIQKKTDFSIFNKTIILMIQTF